MQAVSLPVFRIFFFVLFLRLAPMSDVPSIPETRLQNIHKDPESLVYAVSHDLRAPLRAIDGFTKILARKFGPQLPGEAQQLLRNISSNAAHMEQLLEHLRGFLRVGRQPLSPQRVPVQTMVREIWRELTRENGRPVVFRLGALPDAIADRASLREIFAQLLSNALKFTRTKKKPIIEVGCLRKKTECVYFVRDNGVGFDMRYAEKLFGLFQRLHRTDEFEGGGVGLAVAHRIVQLYGGRIWAKARPQRGATFYFSLPNENTESVRVLPASARNQKGRLPQMKLRVLLVEDNASDRELIRSRLDAENFDCEMVTVSQRAEFIAALGKGGFDLILSDYSLPQFDGISALRLVRARQPDLPFILVSGTLGEEQAIDCLKLGATDYVIKQRLARLGFAIRRALQEAQDRARQRGADEAVRELSGRLLQLQDEERRRVARELHDSVAQNLLALGLSISAAQRAAPPEQSKLISLLADCSSLADQTANALRTVSYLLHPPVLDSLGLPGALSDYARGFTRRSGIKVDLKVSKDFGRLSRESEITLFRVVQESLANVHRHSGSSSAKIALRRKPDQIVLQVQDFGRGIPPEALQGRVSLGTIGVGIAGMRERLQQLQGRLEIDTSPAGTCIRAVVPYRTP